MVLDPFYIWYAQKRSSSPVLFHFQITSTTLAAELWHPIAMEEVDNKAPRTTSLTHAGTAQHQLLHAAQWDQAEQTAALNQVSNLFRKMLRIIFTSNLTF